MRWFFYALLLSNIGLFGWIWYQQMQPAPAMVAVAPADEGAHSLTLLSEMNSAPRRPAEKPVAQPPQRVEPAPINTQPPPSVSPPSPVVAETPAVCVRITDLDSEQDANTLAQVLERKGASVAKRGSDQAASTRYWVLLPPFKSGTAARAALERLKKAGLKDYYLVRSGESRNAISLGVYSSKDSAERRLQQVHSHRFDARIDEIQMTSNRWWLELNLPASLQDGWRSLLPGAMRTVQASACR